MLYPISKVKIDLCILRVNMDSWLGLINTALSEKQLLRMGVSNGKSYDLFPCKILHIENKLSLIGEDANDRCLSIIPIEEIVSINVLSSDVPFSTTNYEVEEFIAAVRAMNENETRLILKIMNPSDVDFLPPYHFLGKPCMLTNTHGDLIWAAYVEKGRDLFEWLIQLGPKVEILNPSKFKQDFLIYCEEKLHKIA